MHDLPPVNAADAAGRVSRRSFVKLLGASMALAGAGGCTRMPPSNIYPYVDQPELTPGLPQFYATSMVLDGCATGLLVESHDGRPTKVEGNPQHPASLGAAGVFEQASLLQLYDPDRMQRIRHERRTATAGDLATALGPATLGGRLGAGGAGLSLLLEPTSSPLDIELLDRLREQYPAASLHFYAPLAPLDDVLVPHYALDQADLIVAVDADLLATGPFHLRYARQYAERRKPESPQGMNRLYVIESSVTVTGTAADHRFAIRPGDMIPALERLLAAVAGPAAAGETWIEAIARDLRAHTGRSVVVAGPHALAGVRAIALEINKALGNVGRTLWFTRSPLAGAGEPSRSYAAFVEALDAGAVDTLVCIGTNPSYATAGTHDLGSLIRRVPQSVYVGLYENETARDCKWVVPAAHFLESWGDARAYDGTLSIVQPLIEPLAGGIATREFLSLLLGQPERRAYDLLRESWARRLGATNDFEDHWRSILSQGLLQDSAFPRESAVPASAAARQPSIAAGPFDVVFRPDSRVHDGAFANNAWLQELPDPVTTLTWDNAAQLSPATANRLHAQNGDMLEIRLSGRAIQLPALIVAGHADETITLHFGYGHDDAESVARAVGVNVYPLWSGESYRATGAMVSLAGGIGRHQLAITQPHHTLATSSAARSMTLAQLAADPPQPRPRTLTLYQPPAALPDGPAPYQWAMTIDLGACIGCGACMVACQAENNVPAVGRDDVLRGREMHWLRIDWYHPDGHGQPLAIAQPMLCQHCEKAPCEYVCPVEATVHSRDGLNEMVYNRCVGTRFCSNNCPYKVRRFNWFDFNANLTPTERLAKNPDVTVRERGVMEKCTFCVQRIRGAEIAARAADQPLRGSDVRTACQQACPTEAIMFGSLDEPDSPMMQARRSRRTYAVLGELGTEPRVLYLARVRNPNPELEPTT